MHVHVDGNSSRSGGPVIFAEYVSKTTNTETEFLATNSLGLISATINTVR